ncbi:septation protein SepH [Brevibacterium yomogidense]|uniref:septation protein SepH n=1 Tax=Brevibacterium yomogidense TaxID=946573 RepID=UPI0018DFE316|nr:septation protein SepH [Brevibacterium yomogidense]
MSQLTLRGLTEDEEALVLVDPTGAEHRLPVDDAVIGAVRRARRAHASEAPRGESLRPRDIQALIRSGLSAEDVAAETGEDVEHIELYERPVLSERRHIAQQAGRVLVYPDTDAGAPTPLAALALQRLELREVDPETMEWDAWKRQDGTWFVELTFVAGSRRRSAGWSYARGSVVAQDDEARWLSDTGPTDSGPIPDFGSGAERRRRAADPLPTASARSAPSRDHQTETGRILESLRRRRGVAPSLSDDEPLGSADRGESVEPTSGPPSSGGSSDPAPQPFGSGGLRLVGDADDRTIDGAHSAPSHPQEAQDGGIVALPADDGAHAEGSSRNHPDQHTEPIGTPQFDVPEPGAPTPSTATEPPEAPDNEDQGTGPGEDHPSLLDDPALDGWQSADGPSAPATGGFDVSVDAPHNLPADLPTPAGGSLPDTAAQPDEAAEGEPHTKRRRGRASVPSWDEIMFGGRGKD